MSAPYCPKMTCIAVSERLLEHTPPGPNEKVNDNLCGLKQCGSFTPQKKHCNFECYPVSKLIVRFSIVRIVIGVSNVTRLQNYLFNCQNCQKNVFIVTVVQIVKNCPKFVKIVKKMLILSKLYKIVKMVKIVKNRQHC